MPHNPSDVLLSRKILPSVQTNNLPPAELSPTRSRTDPPASPPHKHEKSHLARRLRSESLRNKPASNHHHHHYRHSARETVQSAIELRPPISFDSLLRRDKKTPDSSRNASSNQQRTPPIQQRNATYDGAAEQAQRVVVKPGDVKKAQDDNAKREKELRASLQNVEEVAMSSTRQLDDTYYTILDKASLLRSTVANLQQLAEESREMHATFQERTGKLEDDTRGLLQSFDNFNAQEKLIDDLVSQLKASKSQTAELNNRLEAARNRVEAYEKREKVKAANRRKRWGAIWGVLVGIVILVVAYVIARNRSAVGSRVHGVVEVMDRLGNELKASVSALKPMPSQSEDPYLKRLFDEI
ncbi:unnamed protein product [Zymoseptoria tritici ST99CH_1A5]|uniref:Uncharacterized protein n=3 Tax=Zymoseptoria tritici TaxID=1047171 RepID=A0A1X7RGF3_ZYMT9|nr:unnamed protein product [Zymoseptoria tritici ST99CH_3D7]SMR42855.1 unnamed protein product [Zymoseptoria tritici ST99CH_1E4]SMR45025.1 unnamed protein product [Zymoseptoria tritici ST99CH_3D1]SMY20190.1 unnamed protein product [Zymoseptoria tritici ST99CH_1A5]